MSFLRVKTISFKFVLDGIDTLINVECEYPAEGQGKGDILTYVQAMTKRLHLIGAESVKGGSSKNPAEKATKATGFHPDDLEPLFNGIDGKPRTCPQCGKDLGLWRFTSGPKSKKPGTKYAKTVHLEKNPLCKWEGGLEECKDASN